MRIIPPFHVWAEQNRILGNANDKPGPFSCIHTPWIKHISLILFNNQFRECALLFGSQCSKTESLLNLAGRHMAYKTTNTLLVEPSKPTTEAVSTRVSDMLRLSKGFNVIKDDEFVKMANDSTMYLGWAGSKNEVASKPIELALVDELGDLKNIPNQGHPYTLTKARIATFTKGFIAGAGTPTHGYIKEITSDKGLIHWSPDLELDNQDVCFIWKLFNRGTRHEFMIQCYFCENYFTPKSKLLHWKQDAKNEQEVADSAYLECPHCHQQLNDTHKKQCVQNGVMIAPNEAPKQSINQKYPNDIASFFVSGLCSLDVLWSNRAVELYNAQNDKTQLQPILNTAFGECFGTSVDLTDDVDFSESLGNYKFGQLPRNDLIITAYTDVQADRLITLLIGWVPGDPDFSNYILDHIILHGPTYKQDIWKELKAVYNSTYNGQIIQFKAIDAGFNPSKTKKAKASDQTWSPHNIYHFARKNREVLLTKGSGNETMTKPFFRTKLDVTKSGRSSSLGLKLWIINTYLYKTLALNSIMDATVFPQNTKKSFFKELLSERFVDGKWIQSTKNNHVFDCFVGNLWLNTFFKVNHNQKNTQQIKDTPSNQIDNDFYPEYEED